MTNSLSNLVNNLPEGLHRIRCTLGNEGTKCESCGIKYKYCHCFFFNIQTLKIITNFLSCSKSYQQKFNKKLKEIFLIHTNFLTMIKINLFCYYEKVFILTNIWMIGKNSIKRDYLKKNFFIAT